MNLAKAIPILTLISMSKTDCCWSLNHSFLNSSLKHCLASNTCHFVEHNHKKAEAHIDQKTTNLPLLSHSNFYPPCSSYFTIIATPPPPYQFLNQHKSNLLQWILNMLESCSHHISPPANNTHQPSSFTALHKPSSIFS